MPNRFVCRFAVGQDNLAYSGIWRVWTAKNQPDLYLAVEKISGELKATVHCPRPQHTGWERHLSFPMEGSGSVAAAVKRDGGPTSRFGSGEQKLLVGKHCRWTVFSLTGSPLLPMTCSRPAPVGIDRGPPRLFGIPPDWRDPLRALRNGGVLVRW
jgi:hypothetical protein